MMTLSAAWLAAAAASTSEPRILVRIWVATGESFRFTDGLCSQLSYPVSVINVSPIERAIDAWTRVQSVGGPTILLRKDEATDRMITTYPLKGTLVNVYIGFASLGEGDFAAYWGGTIDDVFPSEVSARLVCKDTKKFLERKIQGAWLNQHPLEVAEDVMDKAGVPSTLVDGTTMDPSSFTSSHSHWVCDRSAKSPECDHSITTPTPASDILNSLAQMLDGGFYSRETGIIEYKQFSASFGAIVDHWTARDIHGDLKIRSLYGNVINELSVSSHPVKVHWEASAFGRSLAGSEDSEVIITRKDTNSQAAFQHANAVGSADTVFTKTIDAPWVIGSARGVVGNPSPGATIELEGDRSYTMCGARWPGFPSGSPPADAQASSTRLVYLLVDQEILSVNLITVAATLVKTITVPSVQYVGGGGAPMLPSDVAFKISCRVASRGLFGTSSVNHPNNTRVYDVTIPVDMAKARITRWKYGAPVIEVRTGLDKYGVQLGDTITLTLDAAYFRAYQIPSLTTAQYWEVVAKKPDPHSDTPGIVWTLELAYNALAAVSSLTYEVSNPTTTDYRRRVIDTINLGAYADCTVFSGFGTSDSGLDVTIEAGVATCGELIGRLLADRERTLTASTTTWVTFDIESESIIYRESASEPTIKPTEAWLWKIVTDGSGVTGATDLRVQRQGLHTALLASDAVAPSKVSTVSEWQNILPNGEFTAWSRPFDDQTLYPPDQWKPGHGKVPGGYTWTDDMLVGLDWSDPAGGSGWGLWYDTTAAYGRTGDTTIRCWYASGIGLEYIWGLGSALIPVSEGELYLIQALFYKPAALGDQPFIRAAFLQGDKSTAVTGTEWGGGSATTGFEVGQLYVVVPTNARYMRVGIGRGGVGAPNVGSMYIDYARMAKTNSAFFLRQNATASAAAGAWTVMQPATRVSDNYGNLIDYGGVTNAVVGPPAYRQLLTFRAGLWTLTAKLAYNLVAGGDLQLALYLNGAPGVGTQITAATARNDSAGTITGDIVAHVDNFPLSAGDTVEAYVYNNSGTAVSMFGGAGYLTTFQGQEKKEV